MIQVTRRYGFSASHRLHTASLSEEENRLLYGKCNNPFGHGHNYVLEVSVQGPVDARSGRAVDPAELDRLVQERVIAGLDHKNLNEEIEEFQSIVPTTENLGLLIHSRLQRAWPSVFPGQWPHLEKVRIAETERNIFVVDANHGS